MNPESISNKPLVYTGQIVKVGERIGYGVNGFAKREVLLSPDPEAKYPKMLQVVLTTSKHGDRTILITNDDMGKFVTVTCFVETRRWTSKTTGKEGYSTECTVSKVDWPDGDAKVPAPAVPDGKDDFPEAEDMPF